MKMRNIIDSCLQKYNKNLPKFMGISFVLCFVFFLLSFTVMRPIPGNAAQAISAASQSGSTATERTITVTGTADVFVVPDEVHITVGIETRNSDFQEAKSENDKNSARVIEITRKYGIDQKYVQSDYIRTYPYYEYDRYYNETSKVAYYVVQKRILIKLKDIEKFEQLLSELTDGGIAMIQNVQFFSTELSKYRNEARKLAVQAARDKAKLIAQEAGCDVGKAITISEEQINDYIWYNSWWGSSWYGGYDQLSLVSNLTINYPGNQVSLGLDESGTVSIGQIKITARIGIIFELK